MSRQANRRHIPTHNQKLALRGTKGTPNSTNRYVTERDERITGRNPVNHASTHEPCGDDVIDHFPVLTADPDVFASPMPSPACDSFWLVRNGNSPETFTVRGIIDGVLQDIDLGGTSTPGASPDYLQYRDEKAQNTAGGTFTSGAWQTRVLNTEVSDTGGHGTLASNKVTLADGTYVIAAMAQARLCDRHQLRLQNTTDATTLVIGQSMFESTTLGSITVAHLRGIFTLAASKDLELQHQCQTTRATDGFGVASNFTTEVYAVLELWKIA